MKNATVLRYLESVKGDYPTGIPLAYQNGFRAPLVVSASKRAIFFISDVSRIDEQFWGSNEGEGLKKIVLGGFKLALDEADFRAGEFDLAAVESDEILVVKFGGADFACRGKKILADRLRDVLANVESKRRLWNEIKRVLS